MKKSNLVRAIILAGSLLLQLSTLCIYSRGAAGDVDLSFDPSSSITSPLSVVAVQPDGKVLVGGPLTFINGTNRFGRARLNVDGSEDGTFISSSFNPDLASVIPNDCPALPNQCVTITVPECSAVQSNGKVLVGGYTCTTEPTIDGDAYYYRYFVARFHADGSRDTSFEPAVGDPSPSGTETVRTLTVQPDGKVLVGGRFYSIKGTNRVGIARLNANGSLDNSFVPGVAVVGPFPALYGAHSVASQPDGQVLVGGYSFTVNGTNYPTWIVRLNDNGSLDLGFNRSFSGGPIVLQPDGKVLVGLRRLNADGTLDTSFDGGAGANGAVNSIALQPDGKVLVGGGFTRINGTNCNQVARLNTDGSLDGNFHVARGVESPVSSLVTQPDGRVLIGGPLTFINGTNPYGRDLLNPDGSVDSTFISRSFNPELTGLIPNEDCPPDFPDPCETIIVPESSAVQSNGKVLVGGYILTTEHYFDGDIAYYRYFIARFHADGSRDTSFEPAVGDRRYWETETVRALAVQPDGKVVIGGIFYSIKGTNRLGIARLNANGSLDNSFVPGTRAFGLNAVALQPDGKVLLGGTSFSTNGISQGSGIVRLNSDGSFDGSFDAGTVDSWVFSVAWQPDGKVVIGGSFTTVNGTNRNRIARLNSNGSLDLSFNPGTGADGVVRAIALQPDGNILIGGDFTTVNGVVRPYVARLYGADVAPSLTIARTMGVITISWPLSATGFVLDQSLTTTGVWSQVAFPYTTNANFISVSTATTTGNKFYRLRKL